MLNRLYRFKARTESAVLTSRAKLNAGLIVNHQAIDNRNARRNHFELSSGCLRKVDYTSIDERTTVSDFNHALIAGSAISNQELGSKWQRSVSSRHFVLAEAAAAVEQFRSEGKTVLLHCVRAESRTPTVAALYGAALLGIHIEEALADVRQVLPKASPNPLFLEILRSGGSAAARHKPPARNGLPHNVRTA